MIISFATVRTMMSICDIFMKTLYGGITTNYTQKNRGMCLALCPRLLQRFNTKGETCVINYRIEVNT